MFLCPSCVAFSQELARLQNKLRVLEANASVKWDDMSSRERMSWDWVDFRCFYCHQQENVRSLFENLSKIKVYNIYLTNQGT